MPNNTSLKTALAVRQLQKEEASKKSLHTNATSSEKPNNSNTPEMNELTLEQRHEIDEYLENYSRNPSNSNKYRIGLHAYIESLLTAHENKVQLQLRASRIRELELKKKVDAVENMLEAFGLQIKGDE